jgi:hypothetical protein
MGRQMDANPDYGQLYLRLLTNPHAIRHYLNLKLAISTDEKLQANAERNIENDFCICTLESSNSRVQLLRQLIAAFNRDMLPTMWLESYDLTLKQASRDEGNECIQIPEEVWGRLQHGGTSCREDEDIGFESRSWRFVLVCVTTYAWIGQTFSGHCNHSGLIKSPAPLPHTTCDECEK